MQASTNVSGTPPERRGGGRSRVLPAVLAMMLLALLAVLQSEESSSALSGGKQVPDSKYPFYARIKTSQPIIESFPIGKWEGACGGSLIDKNSVLTAAHCIGEDPEILKKYGTVIVQGQERKICDVQWH